LTKRARLLDITGHSFDYRKLLISEPYGPRSGEILSSWALSRGLKEREVLNVARIAWIEDADAQGQLAQLYDSIRAGSLPGMPRERLPDILRTMSLRPDFLAAILNAARLHFSDGALTRAQHEMIASYVSAINRCHY
jgi:hypothetical protein